MADSLSKFSSDDSTSGVSSIESSAFTPIPLSSVEQRVLELELAIPNDKTKELKVYVSDKEANIAVWNLGRLY